MVKSKSKKFKNTFSWMNPKLEVRKVRKYGKKEKGVFAKSNIKRDEVVTIFGGYVIAINEFKRLPKKMQNFAYHISRDFLFGPIKEREIYISEYFNHSCDPNTGFMDQLTLVAMRNIKKDEEITFDYAICMTSTILDIKCFCNSKNCRKTIKGNDWKISGLQKKYRGYFQPYIQKMINKK